MLIEIPVPIRRQMIKQAGRAWMKVFTRLTVTGKENIPAQGPYIAIGNHVAAIEVALMVANLPQVVELVGNGDVPLDPLFGGITRWYSFIAIKRGYVDRAALHKMCAVLERGGVLGVFPEGGIWEHDAGAARPGVAWVSQQTGAPILPIGFGGVLGALDKAIHLKRPRLTMTIGPLMPPVANPAGTKARREVIETASAEMMQRIRALVPSDNGTHPKPLAEQYTFNVEITCAGWIASGLSRAPADCERGGGRLLFSSQRAARSDLSQLADRGSKAALRVCEADRSGAVGRVA